MLDLIVIGGGFWGTCCALAAQDRHWETLLLDDLNPHGASRNAAGIVSLGWYRWRMTRDKKDVVGNVFADTFRPSDAAYGVNYLREHGLLRQTGEQVFTLAGNQRFKPDLYLLSAPDDLFALASRTWAKALKLVRERGFWRVECEERHYRAARVIVTAGAFTDELLTASGLSPIGVNGLRGRGILIDSNRPPDVPLTIQTAPYTHLTIRPWADGLSRVGDTVERKPGGDEKLQPLKAFAGRVTEQFQIKKVFDGLRPVLPKVFIGTVAPGLVVATGGQRVGLALAPRAAQLALAALE